MRLRTIASIVAAAALLAASPAAAAPRLVAHGEAFGGAAFAGDDVVYVTAGPHLDLTRVTPDGISTTLTRFPGAFEQSDPYDDGNGDSPLNFAAVDGSAAGVVADVFTGYETRYTDINGSHELAIAPSAGELVAAAGRCNWRYGVVAGVGVSGDRAAFVQDDCTGGDGPSHVVIRDLRTGAQTLGPESAPASVRIAGSYIAYGAPGRNAIDVYDLDRAAPAYSVDSQGSNYVLQSDGKLVTFTGQGYNCGGTITWYSPAEPTAHKLAGCADDLFAVESDQILMRRNGQVGVSDLSGNFRALQLPVDPVGNVDLDNGRLAFAGRGCSFDTGTVWTAELNDPPAAPVNAPRCAVRFPRQALKVSRHGEIRVRLTCPTGCRGGLVITKARGGRITNPALPFDVAEGGSRSISSYLIYGRKIRRAITVRAVAQIEDGHGGYFRYAAELRLRP